MENLASNDAEMCGNFSINSMIAKALKNYIIHIYSSDFVCIPSRTCHFTLLYDGGKFAIKSERKIKLLSLGHCIATKHDNFGTLKQV